MRARATCPLDCPDACSLLLTLEEGRLLRVEGDPRHPITQGFACAKTYRYPERVRERLLYPLRRVGRKGEGKFVRVSWEEALDEIAKRLDEKSDLVYEKFMEAAKKVIFDPPQPDVEPASASDSFMPLASSGHLAMVVSGFETMMA